MSLENISCQKSFGGWHKRYRHRSDVLGCDMVFAVYLPPQAEQGGKLPVLYWLSGLTCTDENFMQKAGAMRMAAELGLIAQAAEEGADLGSLRAIVAAPVVATVAFGSLLAAPVANAAAGAWRSIPPLPRFRVLSGSGSAFRCPASSPRARASAEGWLHWG